MNTYITAAAAVVLLLVGLWYLNGGSAEQQQVTAPQQEESRADSVAEKPRAAAPARPAASPRPTAPDTTPAPVEAEPTPLAAPQATYVNADDSVVFVVLPRPGDAVSPNVAISGTARGDWFTQGTFWAEVIAENGDVLVRAQIPAKGNTMTTGLVQFSSSILISSNYRGPATVKLLNDNPPGHHNPDRSVSIPVVIE